MMAMKYNNTNCRSALLVIIDCDIHTFMRESRGLLRGIGEFDLFIFLIHFCKRLLFAPVLELYSKLGFTIFGF